MTSSEKQTRLLVDLHVKYIQSLDTVNTMYIIYRYDIYYNLIFF